VRIAVRERCTCPRSTSVVGRERAGTGACSPTPPAIAPRAATIVAGVAFGIAALAITASGTGAIADGGAAPTIDGGTRVDGFAGDVPRFVEEAAAAGVRHRYDGPWEHFVGGGVAVLDCDADRRPDLYVAGGAEPAALFVNESAAGGPLRFARRTPEAADLDGVTGAYPLDVDDDGHVDLVVLRVGANRLLRGGPDCTFAPADALWGFDGGRAWTTAFSAIHEPGARFPTLAFGNYVDRTAPGSPWGTCDDNVLLRPQPSTGHETPGAASGGSRRETLRHERARPPLRRTARPVSRALRPVAPVHRLEPLGQRRAPRDQRPSLPPRW